MNQIPRYNYFNSARVAPLKRKSDASIDEPIKRARLNDYRPEVTVNCLPNELLWEIFSYLDHDSLLCANLVNRNWSGLIVGTSLNEEINRLFINAKKVDHHVPDLTRKYRSVRFDDIVEWKPELMAQMRAIGKDISSIAFTECIFYGDDFIQLLQAFPNVKFMEISCCYEGIAPMPRPQEDSSQIERVEMQSLRTLVCRGYSWPLRSLSTPNLRRFEVETIGLSDQDMLIAFLNDQQQLKTLYLVDIYDLFDSRNITIQPQFKLKQLVMVNLPFLDKTQVINFLRHMEDSVELLDLGLELNIQICEYILLNFNNVSSLKIDYECFPRSRTFYQKMHSNKNLKYLALYGNMRSSTPLIYFLRRHRKLEELMMSELHGLRPECHEFWKPFSALAPNLITLSVRRLNVYNMVYIKQKHLRHLDVDYIGYAPENVWTDFCKNNPSIENFHIFSRYQEYFLTIRSIIYDNLKNLKDLFISN